MIEEKRHSQLLIDKGLFDVNQFASDNRDSILTGFTRGKTQDQILGDILGAYAI